MDTDIIKEDVEVLEIKTKKKPKRKKSKKKPKRKKSKKKSKRSISIKKSRKKGGTTSDDSDNNEEDESTGSYQPVGASGAADSACIDELKSPEERRIDDNIKKWEERKERRQRCDDRGPSPADIRTRRYTRRRPPTRGRPPTPMNEAFLSAIEDDMLVKKVRGKQERERVKKQEGLERARKQFAEYEREHHKKMEEARKEQEFKTEHADWLPVFPAGQHSCQIPRRRMIFRKRTMPWKNHISKSKKASRGF